MRVESRESRVEASVYLTNTLISLCENLSRIWGISAAAAAHRLR